jgi:hypothetical protein
LTEEDDQNSNINVFYAVCGISGFLGIIILILYKYIKNRINKQWNHSV